MNSVADVGPGRCVGQAENRDVPRYIGRRVRFCRLQLELSPDELARRLSITTSVTALLESGIDAQGFPPARLTALAQALEVSVDFFFPPISSSPTAPGAEIALFRRSASRHRRRQTSRLSREG